jgi:hypothetical protein
VHALTGTALGRAALALTASDVLHALDHARQSRDLAGPVCAAGVAGWIALAIVLVLVARRHRLAAPYAAGVGVSVAVGFVAVHLAPHWSTFSDPYPDANVDALSWALVVVPVVAAVNLIATALRAGGRARQSYV